MWPAAAIWSVRGLHFSAREKRPLYLSCSDGHSDDLSTEKADHIYESRGGCRLGFRLTMARHVSISRSMNSLASPSACDGGGACRVKDRYYLLPSVYASLPRLLSFGRPHHPDPPRGVPPCIVQSAGVRCKLFGSGQGEAYSTSRIILTCVKTAAQSRWQASRTCYH